MPKKKIVKSTKKSLTICPSCGRIKAKDERIVTADRMNYINEVMQRLDGITLS